MNSLPSIAVTMGDPAGVGPELCLRLLADGKIGQTCFPVIFGDRGILRRVAEVTGLPFPAATDRVIHVDALGADLVTPGRVGAHTGRAGFAYVEAAIRAVLAGEVAAVATAPLHKEALHAAGVKFPGHTEIFAARTKADRWCMMQYSEEVTCAFVTVHVGYAEVPKLITLRRILDVIELTHDAVARLRERRPKIVVLGLNPHAGEGGLFGDREEERVIRPAVDAAVAKGIDVEGPIPPDTAFIPARRRSTDAFVCMYHDQGHIPVKALAFDRAVNTTLGLPIVRTSVDHGAALDIAWQGKADPGSLFAAVRLAKRLADISSGG